MPGDLEEKKGLPELPVLSILFGLGEKAPRIPLSKPGGGLAFRAPANLSENIAPPAWPMTARTKIAGSKQEMRTRDFGMMLHLG